MDRLAGAYANFCDDNGLVCVYSSRDQRREILGRMLAAVIRELDGMHHQSAAIDADGWAEAAF